MDEIRPFTIESFYSFVTEKKLMGAKCNNCGRTSLPPRPMCTACRSTDLAWQELPKQGTLLTYTVIHVAPDRFSDSTPYAVGIVEMKENARLPGAIRSIDPKDLKIGMQLTVAFDQEMVVEKWPQWPRYYFKP
ncbi:MAG: Zn-ribbon domain-containing OB-fold protein [Candidatus Bathyarchaeota archaeon]|nr:MAG: Zn-ribbon domain-containing OB-fold protein [Candidatus Bathyarchaeota archaeon]